MPTSYRPFMTEPVMNSRGRAAARYHAEWFNDAAQGTRGPSGALLAPRNHATWCDDSKPRPRVPVNHHAWWERSHAAR